MNSRATVTIISALALITGSSLLLAGPLTPPAGPIGPSMKTLSEVEARIAINATNTPGDADSLFKITQPGSYYLTGNLAGVAGKHGVEIAVSGVTIDLNGFKAGGAPGSLTGVFVSQSDLESITVRNGSISNWGLHGVDTVGFEAVGTLLKDLRCSNNGGNGIRLYRYGRAVDCSADDNAGFGFDSYSYCTLSNCGANGNNANGFDGATSSRFTGCIATGNAGTGMRAGQGSAVTGCTANSNGGSGISTSGQCLILQNTCYGNSAGAAGIAVSGGDTRIEGNNCTGNGIGVSVTAGGNVILRNTCSSNNVNWSISANNVYGTIVDRTAVAGGAVNGNAAASTLGTTDGNANVSY